PAGDRRGLHTPRPSTDQGAVVLHEVFERREVFLHESLEPHAEAHHLKRVANLAAERLLAGQPEAHEEWPLALGLLRRPYEAAADADADDAVCERAVLSPAPVDVDVHRDPLVSSSFGVA